MREAMHGVRRELKEKRSVNERRVAHSAPEAFELLGGVGRLLSEEPLQERTLIGFHSLDDRRETTGARAEVMVPHTVAGAEGSRQSAQARVPNAVGGEVVDGSSQEPVTARRAHSAP